MLSGADADEAAPAVLGSIMFFAVLVRLLSQRCCVDLCLGGLLLFLAGLQQAEAAAAVAAAAGAPTAEMVNLNWKPFIYGGMASIVAEFGRW